MSKLTEFLEGYPNIEYVGFSPPTCGALERGYERLFLRSSFSPGNGELKIGTDVVGRFAVPSPVYYLEKWMEEQTPEGPFDIMIYNPYGMNVRALEDVQVRNAIVRADKYLFAAVLHEGLRIRRPLKPHYQAKLLERFDSLLGQIDRSGLSEVPMHIKD